MPGVSLGDTASRNSVAVSLSEGLGRREISRLQKGGDLLSSNGSFSDVGIVPNFAFDRLVKGEISEDILSSKNTKLQRWTIGW